MNKGKGIENKISTNTMNSWVKYVKEYASKNGMKYNEALKDPKCKAGYKKGGMLPITHQDKQYAVMAPKQGWGVIDQSEFADQRLLALEQQLGANAGKKYVNLGNWT